MGFSVFLPKTSFAMKGKLAQQEPLWLEWWNQIDLYKQQRIHRKERPLFVLHGGPPFANGPIHLGHALNYILKDFVNRWKGMKGYDVSFIPGWDCHGLPIEAKIEEEYRKTSKGHFHKADVLATEFRQACRQFAERWIDVQKKGFQRLGISGDWKQPYLTMDFAFEARILHHLFRLMNKGYVYRGLRPVWWSSAERTALAEAEIEYKEVVSKAIYVKFPLIRAPLPELAHASVVIWTTTPWSLPGNRAVSYGTCLEYVVCEVKEVAEKSWVRGGERLIVARPRLETFCQEVGIVRGEIVSSFPGTSFQGAVAAHPWAKEGGYTFEVPLVPSEYTAEDAGTGLVHIAPGHGVEDFVIGKRYQLEVASPLSEEGKFYDHIPIVGGLPMEESYATVRQALIRYGALAGERDYTHSYPHSWRSKQPLFYRTTPQWFIALDGPGRLRQKALQAIKTVKWVPESAENRIAAMVSSRPDWCISRQRLWGVPIAEFFHVRTGHLLNDPRVHARIEEKVAREGVDFWFTDEAFSVLEGLYDKQDWVKSEDIIDVWFESGVTHEIVLKDRLQQEGRDRLAWPASLYVEGSDQHRGWFQASLMTSVALEEGKAPYESVLTHGFLLDEKGRKMSKSLGNVISPQEVTDKRGADILRLWVAYEDYQKDMRAGEAIFDRVEDMYRRFRNTLRYALGALSGFSAQEYVQEENFSLLDKWIHHRLHELDQEINLDLSRYDFRALIHRLHLFCTQDLSSFYFDVAKDVLYCDAFDSLRRQGVRTTLFHILWCLTHWLAPILCFTAEEAFSSIAREIFGLDPSRPFEADLERLPLLQKLAQGHLWTDGPYWSVHLSVAPQVPNEWVFLEENKSVHALRTIRSAVTSAIEKARERKEISSSLQAAPLVYLAPSFQDLPLEALADICLTSSIEIVWTEEIPVEASTAWEQIGVKIRPAAGEKCERCWRVLQEVQDRLCQRCTQVVKDEEQEGGNSSTS